MKTKKIILLLIFPMISARIFAQKTLSDDTFYEQYSDIFYALSSPPVKNLPDGVSAVRLISISSNPCYIICLVWTKDIRVIVFTEGDVDGTKIVRKKTLAVSDESVKELLALIEEKDFYNQPTYVHNNGRDGETWFVELNINGKYKAVERWLPMQGTEFLKEIGHKLFQMAGEGKSQEEIDSAWEKSMENYNDNLKLRVKKK